MNRTRRRLRREISAAKHTVGPISRSDVERWMASGDLRVLMDLSDIILEHPERISPPMSTKEVCQFALVYFKRSFLELPRGEYADTKYCVAWFRELWKYPSGSLKLTQDFKQMLVEVYRSGNADARVRVRDGVLEHLCENRETAEFFSDWKDDPELSDAYKLALEWGKSFWQQTSQLPT